MSDEYIIQDNSYVIRFLKNGVLHREAGPAVFYKKYEDKYLNLGDENLYVGKHIEPTEEEKEKWGSPYDQKYRESMIVYMIDGKPYSKDDFDLEIKKIQTLKIQAELNKELKLNENHIKKAKL